MMTRATAHSLGLRATVRVVLTRKLGPSSPVVVEEDEWLFDREGNLTMYRVKRSNGEEWETTPVQPQPRFVTVARGTYREEDVTAASWSDDVLHGVGFGTHGAHVARTRLDESGRMVETLLLDHNEKEVSVIRYVWDHAQRLREVVQYVGGNGLPLLTAIIAERDRPMAGPIHAFSPGAEQFRVSFAYNEEGLVTVVKTAFAEQVIETVETKYNDHQDPAIEIRESDDFTDTVVFSYEYDEQGNWTSKVVRQDTSQAQYLRTITYW